MEDKVQPSNFELVQVHTRGENEAEVTVRDRNNWLVFEGILKKHPVPKSMYPADYELGCNNAGQIPRASSGKSAPAGSQED